MDLPRYRDCIDSPHSSCIPPGAVITYDGTNRDGGGRVPLGQGMGHAEIYLGNGEYCSDYVSSTPGGAGRIQQGQSCGGGGENQRCLQGVWVSAEILRESGIRL